MSAPARGGDDSRDVGRGAAMPRTDGLRLVGNAFAKHLAAPLGTSFREDASDVAVALGPDGLEDPAVIARALPDPSSLPPGALVVVLPSVAGAPSLTKRVLQAFGRTRAVPRVLRCTALVLRGFVEVGGGVDPASRTDLAWGRAPG